jgi:hypothetical protein
VYNTFHFECIYTPYWYFRWIYKRIMHKRKKDSDMKIEKTTYKDRKERPIGMTAYYARRPDKVLFFADTRFLFFKSRPTLHTLASRTTRHTNQNLSKSAIFPTLFNIFAINIIHSL